jgi:sialate O-acetylesterase
MNTRWNALLLASVILLPMAVAGQEVHTSVKPFLHPLFSDNMVLQRDRPVPIWGWTQPGRKVTVRIAEKTATAIADAQGKWMVKIGPLPAGGPYTVSVSGPASVTLNNVLAGDVWVCSGQSNMAMGIGNVNNAEQEIADANYPQIRLFTVPNTIATEPAVLLSRDPVQLMGIWSVCTPKTVATGGWNGFSAVGYFFGRDLYQQLRIPIGLIHTSWGGTPAEAWTSADALKSLPDFRPALDQLAAENTDQSHLTFAQKMEAWWAKNDPGSASGAGWAAPDFDASAWKTMTLPTVWEKAGLPGFDGIVWFRKEIALPEAAAGAEAMLHLGPIDDRDTTWVNGVKVGQTNEYTIPRDYKLPAGTLRAGKNLIAVRVLDTGGDGGIYGAADQMKLEVGGQSFPLAGDWLYQASTPLSKTSPAPQRIGEDPTFPTVLYNGMISPLLPYGIKGAIWYQGEANVGRAAQYRKLLPTLIGDWRSRFQSGEFPFFIVQLANFMETPAEPREDAWAELCEAQQMTARTVPRTGLAVSIDIGDAKDIHPKNKQEVGRRLALNALALVYGQKVEYSGPVYRSMKQEGNAIRLTFTHVGDGLVPKGGDRLEGFAIAGEDKHFVWADAKIEGSTVVVSSPKVPNPVAVRYAWASNPVCNLYNRAGLPASPFRTDAPTLKAARR